MNSLDLLKMFCVRFLQVLFFLFLFTNVFFPQTDDDDDHHHHPNHHWLPLKNSVSDRKIPAKNGM